MYDYPAYQYPDFPPQKQRRKFPWLHLFLFLATIGTTILAGGVLYSATLLAILGTHELGHYWASKRWKVQVTLPYFIPAPTLVGTFGAFIKMRSPIPDRKVLFQIGVAGPLAGFVVALPALIIGLWLSEVRPSLGGPPPGSLSFGSSLLITLAVRFVLGVSSDAYDILLHPIGVAAWFGLFVTALNLIPIGQFDGGHIIYALFPRRYAFLSRVAFLSLIPLGYWWWEGWLFWAFL
ncbi:MAG: site-2 protease family protein, partial [Nitrospinota bacterium]